MAILAGKLEARRATCAPLAGKSTLNRLEHASWKLDRYHKIGHDDAAIGRLFVDLFLNAHRQPPARIVIDLDATDDPLHGHQEGRFFHGYGACPPAREAGPGGLLLLSAVVRVLRSASARRQAAALEHRRPCRRARRGSADHGADPRSLAARSDPAARQQRLRPRRSDGPSRPSWPASLHELDRWPPGHRWCEANRVDFVFGLARNARLETAIAPELARAEAMSRQTGSAARLFKELRWTTLDSWSRKRRVIAPPRAAARVRSADRIDRLLTVDGRVDAGRAQPPLYRHLAQAGEIDGRQLYEVIYCARGEPPRSADRNPFENGLDRLLRSRENRIKECQLDLGGCPRAGPRPDPGADRTSAATMRANQLRLWFASAAYVLLCALRRVGLPHTPLAQATCGTIRLQLLKIGALVWVSCRRVKVAMASAFPCQSEHALAHLRLARAIF